jgi:hypothetical protein
MLGQLSAPAKSQANGRLGQQVSGFLKGRGLGGKKAKNRAKNGMCMANQFNRPRGEPSC